MKFVFKAKTKQGELKEGIIEAVSNEAAIEVLQRNELFPISIKEERKNNTLADVFLGYFDRISVKELMVFFRQLAILIEAKVPIITSLSAIKDQTGNKYFQKIIQQMINDIQDGLAFSNAMAKHKKVFSNLSINVIKAGEVSGNLKNSVEYVADNMEKNYALARKIKSAMTYPVITLITFFIIAFLVVSFIVPKITLIIKELNADTPWYTRAVIGASDFMAGYWWAVGIVIAGFFGGVVYYLKTEEGKVEWDSIKLRLPIFGRLFQYLYVARFAGNLAVLLAGGVPIIRALSVVSSVINNSVYQGIILKAAEEVKIGGNMSSALKKSTHIPAVVSQMVKIGEESGQVDFVLQHIAKFYEQETDEMTKNISTLIEPVLTVVIGVAVGFLAFSVIMPIYNIAGQL